MQSTFPVARRADCVRGAVLVVGLAVAVLAMVLAPTPAQAATASPGTLKVSPARATAGDTADAFTFSYTAPNSPTAGIVTISVPVGFSRPQVTAPGAAGYLATLSTCGQFNVNGVTVEPDGSATIAIAIQCATQRSGTMTYQPVAVPAVARVYEFTSTYTASGSTTPVAFADQRAITVAPGPVTTLSISPSTVTVAAGVGQPYTAQGADAFGNSIGNVTAATRFRITPNGSCTRKVCTATLAGAHTVTGTDGTAMATAALTVLPKAVADLAIAETVDHASPAYDTTVAFTTTVTNLSSTTVSNGVTVAVSIPVGLTAAVADSPGYDVSTGVWTIGNLAPGASATLHITGLAGDVALGTQTVNATVQSPTADPNPINNTTAAGEASVPAPVEVIITPSPANPPNVDIGLPGDLMWTASEVNADNPSAPLPAGTIQWYCTTGSDNPCPPAQGTDVFDVPTLTYVIQQLEVDTYTLIATFMPNDPNYDATDVSSVVQFSTTNSGASG